MTDGWVSVAVSISGSAALAISLFAVMRQQVKDLLRAQSTAPTGKDVQTLTDAIKTLGAQVHDISHRRLENAERELGVLQGWRQTFSDNVIDRIERLEAKE